MKNDTNSEVELQEVSALELTAPRTIKGKVTGNGGKKISVTHAFRAPTHDELKARDAAQPYRAQSISEDEEEVLTNNANNVDYNLYEKLVVATTGYKRNVTADQSDTERALALRGIPRAHRTSALRDLFVVNSEIVYEEAEDSEEFEWTEDQSYRVRTTLGTNADIVFYSNVKEPSELQLEKLGGATRFILEKGTNPSKPVTKILASLDASVNVFNTRIESMEQVNFSGVPVNVKDSPQLARLNSYIKRSIVSAVVKETSLDLGE
jgi:hypothetical protein